MELDFSGELPGVGESDAEGLGVEFSWLANDTGGASFVERDGLEVAVLWPPRSGEVPEGGVV